MKVTKELFDLSNEILETYDPGKLKQKQIQQVEQERTKIWNENGTPKENGGNNHPSKNDKWDKIGKDIDNQEKMEEANQKDYH